MADLALAVITAEKAVGNGKYIRITLPINKPRPHIAGKVALFFQTNVFL